MAACRLDLLVAMRRCFKRFGDISKAAEAWREQRFGQIMKETCKETSEAVAKQYEACIETLHEKIAWLTATIEEMKQIRKPLQ